MRRLLLYDVVITLLILLLSTNPSSALKQPTSYCKCICFQNSTIIPLNSPPSSSSSSPAAQLHARSPADTSDNEDERDQKHHTLTCNDCNRAFCLDYNLPICKNAKEEDVFAQCFQRDSLKDRTVVTIFLVATVSLLVWALVKPYVVKAQNTEFAQKYTPMSAHRHGLSTMSENGELPAPNGGGGMGSRPQYSSDANGVRVENTRPGRIAGGRGSISRQGGLNS